MPLYRAATRPHLRLPARSGQAPELPLYALGLTGTPSVVHAHRAYRELSS